VEQAQNIKMMLIFITRNTAITSSLLENYDLEKA